MKILATSIFAGLMLAITSFASPAVALDAAQKEEIGTFIREYLIANPEIFEEVQMALQAKREAEIASKAADGIAANSQAIFNEPTDIVLGNPEGDVTVVEFYDYNCGYCKRAMADMDTILADDPNVRFVLKEFPILGPDSLAAHTVAMSFRKLMPEKYGDFHRQLLGADVRATGDTAMAIAVALGADEAAVTAGMEDPEIDASIRQVYQLSDALGINGTPSYVIGDEAVYGARGADELKSKIANVRECKSTIC